MKNTKLYPFERNKYFYGKLLSVEDFNAEQKYMNDKRRLANRLLHGIGVVAGMNVVRLDDQTLSLESGMAFDSTGREIVVDTPVTKKLSLISGYDSALSNSSNAYVYLCIEYSENEKGEAHNIAAADSTKQVYDTVKEAYSLYLTSAEPDDEVLSSDDLFEGRKTVFWDGNIRIRQVLPRYVRPDGRFTLRVEIESYTKRYAAFSYDVQLICLNETAENSSILRISFDEMLFEKTGKYTLDYELSATDVVGTEGVAVIDPATFTLSYDKKPAQGEISGKNITNITDNDIAQEVKQSCFRQGMDSLLRSTLGQRLYLARIHLINAVGSIIIESIENVPFRQYISGQMLLSAMDKMNCGNSDNATEGSSLGKDIACNATGIQNEIASGVCRINLDSGSYKNKTAVSDEIIHGLGLGSVTIVLGLLASDNSIVYGSPSVFKDDVPQFDVAAKLNPTKGSFVIAVMSKATTVADFVDVKWTAIRDVEEAVSEKSSMRLSIKPNSLVLKPRESRYLETVCSNMTNKAVIWSVASENGGEIDSNGLYAAPNTEGVYEVIARSAAYPDIKASIMVVVRE